MKEGDKLPLAKAYWELGGYERARELQQQLFELSKNFPADEKYSLTDQLRRASRSVGAQIAEAWGKRHYIRHFESKLTDALGETTKPSTGSSVPWTTVVCPLISLGCCFKCPCK